MTKCFRDAILNVILGMYRGSFKIHWNLMYVKLHCLRIKWQDKLFVSAAIHLQSRADSFDWSGSSLLAEVSHRERENVFIILRRYFWRLLAN